MSAEFEAFTKALEQRVEPRQPDDQSAYEHVTVLGGGAEGRLLAALCLAQNRQVTLFSAYGAEINSLRSAGGITLRGDGPIGTFQVDLDHAPSVHTTAELDSAVASAEVIFLTGPVHKHRTYAMVLAEHLRDGQTLVICPARTFGALEVSTLLKVGGCRANVTVVEVQQLPYWIATAGNMITLSGSGPAPSAVMPAHSTAVLTKLEAILPNLVPVANTLHSSFADGSGVVESIGLMFGDSALAHVGETLPAGAEPLNEHRNFHTLIASSRCRSLASAAFDERRQVASRFGVRNLPDDDQWLVNCAGSDDQPRFRPDLDTDEVAGMLRSAVAGSLIPLQSAGRLVGIATPMTDSLVTLAGGLLGSDVGAAGRRLEAWGITASDADEARKIMESRVREAN